MNGHKVIEEKINIIDKNAPLPLYYQLLEIIKRDIDNGIYQTRDMIPSERDLEMMYGISRTPVRQAINALVTEGILIREHGRGTFVAEKKIEERFLERLNNFSEEMQSKGLEYTTELIEKEIIDGNEDYDEIFGKKIDSLIKFTRLRYVEGEPYVVVTTYIPFNMVPGFDEVNLEKHSFYQILRDKYHFKINHATRVIEAINASKEDALLLGINEYHAVQMTKTVAYLDDNTAFEYSIARYRGDLSRFTVHVRNN